jgi:beta-1,2-mannosidase
VEPLTREGLQRSLDDARVQYGEQTSGLSESTFLEQYPGDVAWAVGPFVRMPELDFALDGEWDDPTGIGWTSASLINPTLIARGDELHLFYRASPRKESLSSRIGHAVYTRAAGWVDDPQNPVVHPTLDDELLGVEDPKVYEADGRWFLFYNGIFPATAEDRRRHPSPGYPVEEVGCDVSVAVSDDLLTWTKIGPVVDHAVTRLWAKGAVIPRDAQGRAVRIGGSYLMYLSEGCDGVAHVGRSDDLVHWDFSPQPYLDLAPLGDGLVLHEVATAIVRGDDLVLDFFYSDAGVWSAGQARYRLDDPFRQVDIAPGGTLAWGGIVDWGGRPVFAQGWDSAPGRRELQFFGLA